MDLRTKQGKSITGMILEETATRSRSSRTRWRRRSRGVLKKADIETRTKQPVSLMPKGLLDKLSREEVLDLIAYVLAKGDRKHEFFQGDAHQHHGH